MKLIDLAYTNVTYPDNMPDRYRMPVLQATQRKNGQWRRELLDEELFFLADIWEGVATITRWWVQPVATQARERRREKRKAVQR